MIQNTTIKVRLHPTAEQAELLEKTFGCCRYIWNRILSRNIGKRRHENMLYLQYVNKLTSRFSYRKKKWQDRKTHCYFDCPLCHAHLRVPKGKGKIMIRCTHCDHRFEAKS